MRVGITVGGIYVDYNMSYYVDDLRRLYVKLISVDGDNVIVKKLQSGTLSAIPLNNFVKEYFFIMGLVWPSFLKGGELYYHF